MVALNNLQDLLIEQLEDLYHAEQQLTRALPRMASAASDPELRLAFEDHLKQTHGHIARLEMAFEALGQRPKAKTCYAMKGLVEEGHEAIKEKAPDSVKDAALIAAGQRVEHYEIAAYGTARSFAESLGQEQVAAWLQETLDEEAAADKLLTQISGSVNRMALVGAGA